jgi:hypothetical protein
VAITMDVGMISELVRTLGIVISGLWVAWTFHKLQQTRAAEVKIGRDLAETEKAVADSRKAAAETNKALADSQKALTDTRKASAEVIDLERRQLSQQPNLEIAFVEIIEHRTSDQPPDVFLSVAIEVRNVGSRNLQMNFSETALTVGRFDLRD